MIDPAVLQTTSLLRLNLYTQSTLFSAVQTIDPFKMKLSCEESLVSLTKGGSPSLPGIALAAFNKDGE